MPAKKKDETKDDPTFEESLARLEEIVEEMEGGELPLERAMALFEEGVALGKRCGAKLDEAEKRITILLEKADGSTEEREFDPSQAGSDEAPRAARPRAAASSARAAASAPRETAKPKPVATDDLEDDDEDDIPF